MSRSKQEISKADRNKLRVRVNFPDKYSYQVLEKLAKESGMTKSQVLLGCFNNQVNHIMSEYVKDKQLEAKPEEQPEQPAQGLQPNGDGDII